MPTLKGAIRRGLNALVSPLGLEVTYPGAAAGPVDTSNAEGFPHYLEEATKRGLDVNDYLEQVLGWTGADMVLQAAVYPYLHEYSLVCNLGVGTGRWARHVAKRIITGEFYLVDHSPWMVDFLQKYFKDNPRVQAYLNDGFSLPFTENGFLDLVFSFGTFIQLKLGMIWLYAQEFYRTLKPGGHAVIEYIDITRPLGWEWLMTQSKDHQLAACFTYHTPATVERVFQAAGFEVVNGDVLKGTDYHLAVLVARKPE